MPRLLFLSFIIGVICWGCQNSPNRRIEYYSHSRSNDDKKSSTLVKRKTFDEKGNLRLIENWGDNLTTYKVYDQQEQLTFKLSRLIWNIYRETTFTYYTKSQQDSIQLVLSTNEGREQKPTWFNYNYVRGEDGTVNGTVIVIENDDSTLLANILLIDTIPGQKVMEIMVKEGDTIKNLEVYNSKGKIVRKESFKNGVATSLENLFYDNNSRIDSSNKYTIKNESGGSKIVQGRKFHYDKEGELIEEWIYDFAFPQIHVLTKSPIFEGEIPMLFPE